MRKKSFHHRWINFAKVLLSISIVLLISGIFLDIQENQKYAYPVEDVVETEEQETFISIDNVGRNINKDSSGDSEVQNNIAPSTTLNLDETNQLLKSEIENNYGVSVEYGAETEGYSITSEGKTVQTESIKDTVIAYNQLSKLKNVLALYPSGLFKEIKEGGIPLTVILVYQYSDDAITGITDSNYNYANISIAATYSFEESFYHESYHYIERYLLKKGADFTDWNELNPEDFSYGNVNNDYSYNNTFLESTFFVNNYAQTSPEEDRASTFEYMMAPNKASCLNNGNHVWEKANKIASTIENIMNSVSSNNTEYWEQHL